MYDISNLYQNERIAWEKINPGYRVETLYASSNDNVYMHVINTVSRDEVLKPGVINRGTNEIECTRVQSLKVHTDLGGPGYTEQLEDMKHTIMRRKGERYPGDNIGYTDPYNYAEMTKSQIWADKPYESR